jgi:hypothetical protein
VERFRKYEFPTSVTVHATKTVSAAAALTAAKRHCAAHTGGIVYSPYGNPYITVSYHFTAFHFALGRPHIFLFVNRRNARVVSPY